MNAATKFNQELLEQYVLAGSTKSSADTLRVLAEHSCDKIRLRVAENPRTTSDILWSLAHDANHDVRVAVAGNPSSNNALLQLLARDNDVVVRHGLAQNIATPKFLLEQLAEDDNGWVRGEAIKSLDILYSRTDEVSCRRKQRYEQHDLFDQEIAS